MAFACSSHDPDVQSRIEVQHIDRLAHRVFRDQHGSPRMISSAEERKLWRSIIDELQIDFSETFLAEEWRQVVLAQRVTDATEYLAAKRTRRGWRLGARQKARAWQSIWEFEEALKTRALHTHETVRREATRILERSDDKPYRHIVVDEAQDLSPDQWRVLRAGNEEVGQFRPDVGEGRQTRRRTGDRPQQHDELVRGVLVSWRKSSAFARYHERPPHACLPP